MPDSVFRAFRNVGDLTRCEMIDRIKANIARMTPSVRAEYLASLTPQQLRAMERLGVLDPGTTH